MSIATTDELRLLLKDPLQVIAKLLTVESGEPYETAGTDWQWEDFEAIFATTPAGYPMHRLCYLERRRGESKTQDMAAVATADLVTGARHQSYAIGGDIDMAGLLVDSIANFCARMPMLAKVIDINRHNVRNKVTGSELKVLAADVATSFGIRPKRVLADELSLWEGDRGERLFTSMWTATAKSPMSQLVGGSMCGWDFASIGYRVRQMALESKSFYFSSREGTEPAPWLSRDAIEEQRQTLHPADFARFWECRWVEPSGSWISVEMFDAAEKGQESYRGDDRFTHVAFIDVGLTHDPTVIAVAHAEGDRAVCDTLKTFQGTKGQPVELEAVEQEVIRLARRYHLRSVRFESPQAVASSQRLSRRLSCNVEFRHPTADTQATLWGNLYRLFSNTLITVYPHAQLRREALSLVTRTVSGRLKVVESSSVHQDHILALGGACEMLLEDMDWQPEANMPVVSVARASFDGVKKIVGAVGGLLKPEASESEASADEQLDPEAVVTHDDVPRSQPHAAKFAGTCGICIRNGVPPGASWPVIAVAGDLVHVGSRTRISGVPLDDTEAGVCYSCGRPSGHDADCPVVLSMFGIREDQWADLPGQVRFDDWIRRRGGQ